MAVKRIAPNTSGEGRRVGIVVARFNAPLGDKPLALQRLAQEADGDALIALGAVIRGDTYHFEIVANESASGVASVQLEFGIPIGNGILTCDTEEQADARADTKGFDAAQAALELANLLDAIDDET
jgi:6,7-dimethyl-8-ribityllumazine synthase